MSNQGGRRVFLRLLVKLLALLAVLAFFRVLFGSLPERDEASEVRVTGFIVTDMQPGDYQLVEWNEKPLYIVYRKSEWESLLADAPAHLYRDPVSQRSTQPESMQNELRSDQAGWFVSLGLGTGSGCALVFEAPGDQTNGGFVDPCDKSRYDLAGRVFSDQAARRNTVVPQWSLDGKAILVSE